jgi:hypothetical protein
MKKLVFTSLFFGIFASLWVHRVDAQAVSNVPYGDCQELAQRWIADLAPAAPPPGQTPEEAAKAAEEKRNHTLESFFEVPKHVTCLASVMPSISRTSLLKALAESFGNSMQQSSPPGSSGSSSPVSKPAGSTSLIQDAGGFSATSNGSALTLQFAPGDLVKQMAGAGVFDFCTSTIQTKGCKSTGWLKVFAPATFSVTGNTTTPGSSVSGTAANTGPAVPVTLKSLSNTLTFGGVTAKYGFLYKKKASDGIAQTTSSLSDAAAKEAAALGKLTSQINACKGYVEWKTSIENDTINAIHQAQTQKDSNALLSFILKSYSDLSTRLSKDETCKTLTAQIFSVLNTVSAYQAAITAQQVLASSSSPIMSLEYDFTTPANKPSYHSTKLNLSWQSTVSCAIQVQAAANKALKTVSSIARLQNDTPATCNTAKGKQTTSSSTSTSAVPTWTMSASGGADIYSDEPSSTIPSASRLRDVEVGAEITRVWHISTYKPQNAALVELLSKMGDLSLVGAYYYQDQTSPSILNGPPSSITFNGLPTTASQVFAARGPINVGQVRLGFGTGTNVRFPVAVSYSNRSDLIVHPFVGVQFGVSYDLFGK